jgi:excisionase family DNA binding protein
MANLSVVEAAQRLGVSVPRIHQRIAAGSLRAHRIGSQWVVDERSVLHAAERRHPGRPLSSRSAWAIIAYASGDRDAVRALSAVERARARERLARLLAPARVRPRQEADVQVVAAVLRRVLGNRARRLQLRAAPADLADLRRDRRWQSLLASADSGIASMDVEGYVAESDAASLVRDHLLVSSDADPNVIAHVVPSGHRGYSNSRLQLAADLAEHRSPREEARAAHLLYELAREQGAVTK